MPVSEVDRPSNSADQPRSPDTLRLPLREGVLTAALGVGIYLALAVVFSLISVPESIGAGGLARSFLALITSWGVIVWIALVAVIVAWRSGTSVRDRTKWILVAAVVAAFVNEAVRFGPAIAFNGPGIAVLFGVPLLFSFGQFVVAFGAGRLLAVQLLARGEPDRGSAALTGAKDSSRPLRIAGIVALAVAWVAMLLLGQQWFSGTFRLFGSEVIITEEQGVRYVVTATVAVAAAVATMVIARARRARATAGIVALVVALLVAFVFQVPPGRFWPEPAPAQTPYNDHPPCMGEGDPNCVGG